MIPSLARQTTLLAERKLHGPTTAVIAIMTFVMLVVAAGGLALAQAASSVGQGVHNRYVIELPASIAADLPRGLSLARSDPSVASVEAVPESELRSTLHRWLGDAADSADLPVPAMILVQLKPGSDPARISNRVKSAIPGARIVAETGQLGPLLKTLRMLEWLAISLVLLVLAATAAAIVLAARGALDTHRLTIEIMHGIGATDTQLSRLFERKFALDAFAGALAGTIAASACLLVIAATGAAVTSGLGVGLSLGAGNVAILSILPILLVFLAITVARWAVLKALRETL
jgi:cell division transport system permease protein